MTKPKLLDLFCGAGGASMGYSMAGFDVVGVDVVPQPNYPFRFVQMDAFDVMLAGFDVVHASPPCQDHMRFRAGAGLHGTGWMLPKILDKLRYQFDGAWVVENVVGANMPAPVTLCGASFGLAVHGMDLPRHRQFSSSHRIPKVPCTHRRGQTIGVYGNGTNRWHLERLGHGLSVADKRQAMGIDWMTGRELSQAIPPAYTEYVGRELLRWI